MSTATTTTKIKKDSARPVASAWTPFKDGVKTRTVYTLRLKGDKKNPADYVPYVAREFENLKAVEAAVTALGDPDARKTMLESGLNNLARQAASGAGSREASMIKNLMTANSKLSLEKATKLIKAALAAE